MNVLITGGTGFMGNTPNPKNGHEVVVVTRNTKIPDEKGYQVCCMEL